MIFTGFLPAIPVAIKGTEMLVAVNKMYFSSGSLVRGVLKNRPSTIVATTWSSRCELARKPTAAGTAFVSLAIFAIAGGIALEFIAKAKVEQNKRAWEKRRMFSVEWDEHLWTRKYLCGNCNGHMHAERNPSSGGLIGQFLLQRKEAKADSVVDMTKRL